MTISTLYAKVKKNTHTDLDRSEFTNLLNRIEGIIYNEIILTHENPDNIDFNGYDDNTDGDTVLIAPDTFAQLYFHYIGMNIDILTGEIERQANSASQFSAAYQSFADWYNRTHLPLQTVKGFTY